jgi:hypothetical protein
MPSKLKNLIRARRTKTGESHEAALRYVKAQENKGIEASGDKDVGAGAHEKLDVRFDSGGGFPRFGADARWLRDHLASKGVRISPDSAMERALRAMTRTTEAVLSPPVADGATKLAHLLQNETGRTTLERFILDGVAGAHLVRAIRSAVEIAPTVFDGKWHLFSGPDVLLARHVKRTSEKDLMWELYLATLCLRAGDDVRISDNGNPDVSFRVRDVRWGIEAKVPNSRRRDRQIEIVKEAIKQLEKSDIDRGFVAVNLTSIVNHSHFRRSVGSFGEALFTEAEILADLQRQVAEIVEPFTHAQFHEWVKPYQKARAIAFQAQTICIAGKTLSLTSYDLWFDLHKPNRAELRDLLVWPHPLDQAMANRFQKAVQESPDQGRRSLAVFCRQVRARSLEHSRAMEALTAAKTPSQMVAILRQELDSIVRVIFLLTQEDRVYQSELIEASVGGQRWHRKGSKDKVTDREMVDLADSFEGWTKAVYKFGCAFIHLSSQHDHEARDPLLALPVGERATIVEYVRHYHHGRPSSDQPTFQDIVPLLPDVFEKISANLEHYLKNLEEGKTLDS